MANTSGKRLIEREIYYFRQRCKNRLFQTVVSFFAEKAEKEGMTKRDLALSLGKDPAQITRWFSGPSNWTIDTVSDLLLAMDGELEYRIEPLDLQSPQTKVILTWGETPKVKDDLQTNKNWKVVKVG